MHTLPDDEAETQYLGQFIPLHYHHNMLSDTNRMESFKAAIDYAVFDGAKVLELGGGTGVLSHFAAAKASKVWCVEFNPVLVAEARRLLALNPHGHKVEVVHADAFEFLPPEPVDIVICEMIHAGMLREKQIEVIESFKARYQQRFGNKLPIFIPTAVIMAVQPVQQDFNFSGYYAPIIQFQRVFAEHTATVELAEPQAYSILDLTLPTSREISWQGSFKIATSGTINALRFFTKNVLTIDTQNSSTIDWVIDYLVLPLSQPLTAQAGDLLDISFSYEAGGSIRSLENSIHATLRNATP